jgi:phage tail sheath protein FI
MASTLISPGVLALENDQSFITQQPITVGAAIIGPTVKGPVEVPTIVTSYSQYQNIFGTTFTSASNVYTYFTSISAYNYFANGGETLLVTRVVSGSFTYAQTAASIGSVIANSILSTTSSVTVSSASLAPFITPTGSFSINGITIAVTGSPAPTNTATTIFVPSGSNAAATVGNITASFNVSSSVALYSSALQFITASASGSTGLFFNSKISLIGTSVPASTLNAYTYVSGSTTTNFSGASNISSSFVLETLSEGIIMNSSGSLDASGALISGSIDNIRWEIQNTNTSSGTFSLLIRQGNDNTVGPIVLETWTNLSLDPFAPNYISKVIGDYTLNYNSTSNQIEVSGSYPNASKYVRVKSVTNPTPNYFDNNGIAKSEYTSSIPVNASGSFTGAIGTIATNGQYYDQITDGNRSQGIPSASYTNMINLLSNADDYRFNVLLTPGLFNSLQTSQVTSIISNTENRGDNIFVLDLVPYGSTTTAVTTQAASRNTSYAASYWPWLQTIDPDTGANVWAPASTMIGGVYAFNDNVSEPWFAPAGINRGGLSQVIRAEQKLPQTSRDTLYTSKVNPIATFPGTGTVVYGQKTLQTKASALDRVNVRRLLISLKSYISQVANGLVFEQNTIATRQNFLNQVNPYLASVQQRQGLYAFKVVMDDSNNTADVIDRNQLVGAIYLQPTKTAEFIYLNFNILPTGVTFPS